MVLDTAPDDVDLAFPPGRDGVTGAGETLQVTSRSVVLLRRLDADGREPRHDTDDHRRASVPSTSF